MGDSETVLRTLNVSSTVFLYFIYSLVLEFLICGKTPTRKREECKEERLKEKVSSVRKHGFDLSVSRIIPFFHL